MLGIKVEPPVPISASAPWVPDADIRATKLAYHIEIEVPSVTDKKSTVIQLLLPRTLLIQGDIHRPDIISKAAEGATEWELEGDGRQLKLESHRR